jgi:hypothetical protein
MSLSFGSQRLLSTKKPSPNAGLSQTEATFRPMILDAVISPHSKRNYANAFDEIFALSTSCGQGISVHLVPLRSFGSDSTQCPSTCRNSCQVLSTKRESWILRTNARAADRILQSGRRSILYCDLALLQWP